MKLDVVKAIMSGNDAIAAENQAFLDSTRTMGLNIMASPGAGKTSLILATAARLPATVRPGVIEGDLASSIDAEKVAAHGIPVVQINTGGNCHLDAPMVHSALKHLPLEEIELLFVENVGNLVCPAGFQIGTHRNIVVASVPEGHDKPYKYPGIFASADAVIINKCDLAEIFAFDFDSFRAGVTMINSDAPIFPLSCRNGAGMDEWVTWLLAELRG